MQNTAQLKQYITTALETKTNHSFEAYGAKVLIEYSSAKRFNDYNASITINGHYLYTVHCMNASNLAGYVLKQVVKELSKKQY
jgi:hypothetical protein